jgi:radical SAM protein with 4Fe4S-binding SPASM domain
MYKQEPPFAIQIELVEGCNLYCNFCGLQGIREKTDKTYNMMSKDTVMDLASQIHKAGWNSRIEFAMHGEPTMHDDCANMVRIFRKFLPKSQLMMTSNGGGLLKTPGVIDNLKNLFLWGGLNVFAFDAYDYVKIKDKVDEQLEGAKKLGFQVHRYPKEREFSPHNRYGHKAKLFIRIKDISRSDKGTHSILNNHCGRGGKPLREPLEALCAKPFRELSVRWDGNVAICCNDWAGIFKVGNIEKDGLLEIWHSEKLNSARRFLMQKDRASVHPCNVCDAKSYRVGLLPDKFGKVHLREPNETDKQNVKQAASGDPYTEPAKRPWELVKIAGTL